MHLHTPELLILLSLLTISRETRGKSWCKNEGVGRMRAMIGEPLPATTGRIDPRIAEYADEQRRAAAILAAHCRVCGKCKLGRDPITPHAPLHLATDRGEAADE